MARPEFTTDELATERWRDVVGYEEMYEVSNLGRIRRKPRMLNPFLERYATVSLRTEPRGKGKKLQLHRLVAATFHGPPNGLHVNHKDGKKYNNRASNLEYVTPAENSRHAREMGLTPTGPRSGRFTKPESFADQRGSNVNTSKLSAEQVKEIRQSYKPKYGAIAKLARQYGVTWRAIEQILKGNHWHHIE